ncbi:MAG: lysylphosphatidylglycerol synthase transmembrane domain-containing protein [Gemmatimonadota bacterium]|nr:lysylphosphatidylglycerol synthase transmembrane domain-containing protein [Gemmatimonadota bacterium]
MKTGKAAWLAVKLLIVLVICYALIYKNIVLNWRSLGDFEWDFRWLPFTASLLWIALTFAANSQVWALVVRSISGRRIGAARAAYIWFISNLGRYLPGKVWQIAGMAVLARREGISGVDAAASAVLGQVIHLLAGAAVGLVFLPGEFAGRLAPLVKWAWMGLPPVLVFLYPPFFKRLLRLAWRWSGKEGVEIRLTLKDLFFWFTLNCAVWLAYGICFYFFIRSVLPVGALSVSAAVGVYAVGYIVGFLAFFTPGGLGVRELMFTGLLVSTLGELGATVVALGSRIWLSLAELVPVAVMLGAYGLPVQPKDNVSGPEREKQ